MSYELQGHFLEACDCNTVCPCWIDDEPDGAECTGLFVWDIDRGVVDGRDVSGLRVASVSYHERKRSTSHQRVVVFVDTRAADDIADALGEVFTGKRGGTLGELGHLMSGEPTFRRSAIDIAYDGGSSTVKVGNAVETDMQPVLGAFGRPITLVDSALAKVFGTPAQVGRSRRFRVSIPESQFDIDVRGRSANAGIFAYRG